MIMIASLNLQAWITGDRASKRSSQSRKPLTCPVCGNPIIRPKFGGSTQIVHAGKGNKKSECQEIWRYAKTHNISIAEAKERLGFKTGWGASVRDSAKGTEGYTSHPESAAVFKRKDGIAPQEYRKRITRFRKLIREQDAIHGPPGDEIEQLMRFLVAVSGR